METVTAANVNRVLQRRLADRYRTVWVYYTRLHTLQVIVFPIEPNSQYKIFTRVKTEIWRKVKTENPDGTVTETKLIDVDIIERFINEEDAQGS